MVQSKFVEIKVNSFARMISLVVIQRFDLCTDTMVGSLKKIVMMISDINLLN